MFKTLPPWQLLVVAAAGWINRDQRAIIYYLQEENRVLREQLDGKRVPSKNLSDVESPDVQHNLSLKALERFGQWMPSPTT